jgi:hypothetical protein
MIFGGPTAIARDLDIPKNTAIKWRSSIRTIRTSFAQRLLLLAEQRQLDLTADDLIFGRWLLPSGVTVSARQPEPAGV